MARVLVTVSRGWNDRPGMHGVLAAVWTLLPGAILVSGANPDGDAMAEGVWEGLGGWVERHRADWGAPCQEKCKPGHRVRRRDGSTFCPAAGMYRNHRMARLGALLCLGFIGPCVKRGCARPRPHSSHGATDCADYAEHECGILTRRYPPAPIPVA